MHFRTFWGMSEYIRIVFDYVSWFLVVMSWCATFLPVQWFHNFFSQVTYWMFFFHGWKYIMLIVAKILAFFGDDYTRDYANLTDGTLYNLA